MDFEEPCKNSSQKCLRIVCTSLESIAPKNSQDRSAWGGPSPSKQNFAWTLNA